MDGRARDARAAVWVSRPRCLRGMRSQRLVRAAPCAGRGLGRLCLVRVATWMDCNGMRHLGGQLPRAPNLPLRKQTRQRPAVPWGQAACTARSRPAVPRGSACLQCVVAALRSAPIRLAAESAGGCVLFWANSMAWGMRLRPPLDLLSDHVNRRLFYQVFCWACRRLSRRISPSGSP